MNKNPIAGRLLVAAFAVAAVCLLAYGAEQKPFQGPTAQTVLNSLRPGHPRLIMLQSDLEQVKKVINENPLARSYSEELRSRAVEILDEKPVEYRIVGPRLLAQSRRCMNRIYSLGLAYRLSGEKRFAERAKKELMAAAAFPDWNPSHFLDTAEMCHAFAIGYDWLYSELIPDERRLIKDAIVEKGLKPAMAVYKKGGWWTETIYNWNQVCNGGIGIGALAIAEEEPQLAAEILSNAVRSIPRAMNTFAPEGGFGEGPGYWNYASSYAVYFVAALQTALGTDFGLTDIPGFSEAGLFRIYFRGPIGKTFNFADAGEGAGNAPQMFWMAKRFDRPVYAWHEREHARSASPLHLIWFDPRGESPAKVGLPLNRHFKGVDVVFFRSDWEQKDGVFVGFKGGDNRVNHSHLDLGTFVLDALGHRWALDLGPDDYNLPAYFGAKRWTYYRLRTEGHNTFVINGENQNPAAAAPIIGFGSSPDRAWAVVDLTAAYPSVKGKAWRGIALLNRSHVLVQDEVGSANQIDIDWAMHTEAAANPKGSTALLSLGEARLLARIIEPADARFDIASANPPPPQEQQSNVKKLVVRLAGKSGNVRLVVLLSPYRGSEPEPGYIPQIEPLEKWTNR